jgi:DNA invertase Pin-like site-specific DNA recombinase
MIAVYLRVSTHKQDTASQEPDLRKWLQAYASEPVEWFTDKATGKDMERPGWKALEAAIQRGDVSRVVVWRLDRLGRTCAGLSALFDDLRERKVGLVSIREGIDLSTPAGRMMANVLASMAQYETEVRLERVYAGIAVAKANGKKWGGSKPGVPKQLTDDRIDLIRRLRSEGKSISGIAETLGVSRPTVYAYVN